MSRTNHARPPRAPSDAQARITSAAIGVADAFVRFQREMRRLHRAVEDGQADGLDAAAILAAIRHAGRGRDDRQQALTQIVERLHRQEHQA